MVETIKIPPLDRFQIIAEHDEEAFVFDKSYLDIERTSGLVFIQICISVGRTVEIKKSLFKAIADRVSAAGVRPEDVFPNPFGDAAKARRPYSSDSQRVTASCGLRVTTPVAFSKSPARRSRFWSPVTTTVF
jgi:hypothetical protein